MKTERIMSTTTLAIVLLLLPPAVSGVDNGDTRDRILETAKKYLGVRYNYGGMGAGGFDCSGFVQFVYRENGILLPRSTAAQFERGKKIGLDNVQPGDLLFFKIYRGRISHVGIYVSGSVFIHAPSSGKRVSFADMKTEYWKKRFAGAVTYIGKH
ncbi:MAG: C40 family peptidase [Spirochaetes bacterium]|nr:C40 family peptidase [Spirochaetota bacterium]